MYPPEDRKKPRYDPVILAVLIIICLAAVVLFYNYVLLVMASIMAALIIAVIIFIVLIVILAVFALPIYYGFFTRNEVESDTSYSLSVMKGSEETEHEKKGKI